MASVIELIVRFFGRVFRFGALSGQLQSADSVVVTVVTISSKPLRSAAPIAIQRCVDSVIVKSVFSALNIGFFRGEAFKPARDA